MMPVETDVIRVEDGVALLFRLPFDKT